MVHEDITAVSIMLGTLAGRVREEEYEIIRNCRRMLDGASEAAEVLERETALALEVMDGNVDYGHMAKN